jgi:beta-ribofuranosylaminobenzene 5'-phosphate synthase
MTVRVVAPCRLHFGLLHVPVPGLTHWPEGTPVRTFGGVGLMVESPAVTVENRRSAVQSFTGSHVDEALGLWIRIHQRVAASGSVLELPRHFHADGPPYHVGLGVGTALRMAVTRVATGRTDARELAKESGRGKRSGIGLYGFELGGLLFDAGKLTDDELPTLHTRMPFPDDWRVVLLRPTVGADWHGDREQAAFDRPRDPAAARASTDRLTAIAFDELAPAVAADDFPMFADAVHRYNRLAGEPFAVDQGGPYAGPEVAELVETLRGWGVAGAGQSSWGPTVFAFAQDAEEANRLAGRARVHFPNLADVTVTAANNRGATVVSTD